MLVFDPVKIVEDYHLILDHGDWPNFLEEALWKQRKLIHFRPH